ncbi:MAG: PspC domain-containing protein [Ignavibacteriales bacterium]|nr:PspC domain-containing protein [Ignavibacteriales bacterium]
MAKRLYRSRTNSVIAGVAGGLGEYLDIDPVLIRIAFVVATFAGGFGIITYIIAWVIMPEGARSQPQATPGSETSPPSSSAEQSAGQSATPPAPEPAEKGRGGVIGGIVLISLGVLFLADNFFPRFDVIDYWPLIFVAIGAGMLYRAVRPTE